MKKEIIPEEVMDSGLEVTLKGRVGGRSGMDWALGKGTLAKS